MELLEESIKQQDSVLLSTDNSVTTNANDVEIGSFEFKRTMTTALGTNVPVRIKAVVFRSADRLIMVQLTAPQQFGKELMPVMDQILESVKLSEE